MEGGEVAAAGCSPACPGENHSSSLKGETFRVCGGTGHPWPAAIPAPELPVRDWLVRLWCDLETALAIQGWICVTQDAEIPVWDPVGAGVNILAVY